MAQIVSLLNGENINQDYQITALHKALINPWIISGLEVTTGQVGTGEAFVEVVRANGERVMVHFQNTSVVAMNTERDGKIFIEIAEANVESGIINHEDGTGIGEIKKADSFPAKNYIPLAEIRGGVIKNSEKITLKNVARKGFTENGFLVVENGEEKITPEIPESVSDKIIEKIDETERWYIEWTIQEDIPDILTPVVYLNGNYKYFKKIEDVDPSDTVTALWVRYESAMLGEQYANGQFKKSADKNIWGNLDISTQSVKLASETTYAQWIKTMIYSIQPTTGMYLKYENNYYSAPSQVYCLCEKNFNWWYKSGTHTSIHTKIDGFIKNKRVGEIVKIKKVRDGDVFDFTSTDGIVELTKNGVISKGVNNQIGIVVNNKLTYREVRFNTIFMALIQNVPIFLRKWYYRIEHLTVSSGEYTWLKRYINRDTLHIIWNIDSPSNKFIYSNTVDYYSADNPHTTNWSSSMTKRKKQIWEIFIPYSDFYVLEAINNHFSRQIAWIHGLIFLNFTSKWIL